MKAEYGRPVELRNLVVSARAAGLRASALEASPSVLGRNMDLPLPLKIGSDNTQNSSAQRIASPLCSTSKPISLSLFNL